MLSKLGIMFCCLWLAITPIWAQYGADEPCNAYSIAVNSLQNPDKIKIAASINTLGAPNFTNSTAATAKVQLLQPTYCNGFTTTTNDWWYTFTVPYSGYFSCNFTNTINRQYFDWVMYTSSTMTCSGSTFTEVASSSQCTANGMQPTLTQVGPLPYGTRIYLRMWHEAAFNQKNIQSYEISINEVAAPDDVPACVEPIFPPNNAAIFQNKVLLQWQTSNFATNYDIYLKDSTLNSEYELVGNSTSHNFTVDNLISSHVYNWYVVPFNKYAESNSNCQLTNSFTVQASPTASCLTALPLCIPGSILLPINRNDSTAGTNAQYGCLTEHTNPTFYWFKVATDGNLKLRLTANPAADVDFVVWGPFYGLQPALASCSSNAYSGFPCGSTLGEPIICENSATYGGDIEIDSAKAGAFYLLMMTNPSPAATTVTVKTFGNNKATYDCMPTIYEFSATPNTDCNNNTYSAKFSLKVKNPPASGSCIVTDNLGHSNTFFAPFANTLTGTITGLTANNAPQNLTAYFTDLPALSSCIQFTSPAPAPNNNSCTTTQSLNIDGLVGNLSGYTSQCAGKDAAEPNYCGATSCKSVFYKLRTAQQTSSNILNIQFKGGNLATNDCIKGLRLALLNNCTTLAPVSPTCVQIPNNNGFASFTGLQPGTDYYLAVTPADCSSYDCSWNMELQGVGVLPVVLGSFEVMSNQHNNVLQWQTLYEQNIAYFEVYRGFDNQHFDKIATITANNFRHGYQYQFTDNNISNHTNFYKIKIVFQDGTEETSVVKKVSNLQASAFSVTIAPNPAPLRATVNIHSQRADKGQILVSDAIGRLLATYPITLTPGNNQFTIPTHQFQTSTLFVNVLTANGTHHTIQLRK